MKIVISNVFTGYIYTEIEDPTSSKVMAYMGSKVIIINKEEYVVDCSAMDHDNNILNIMVLDSKDIMDDTEEIVETVEKEVLKNNEELR